MAVYSAAGAPYGTPEEVADWQARGNRSGGRPGETLSWAEMHPFTKWGRDQYGKWRQAPPNVPQWVEATPAIMDFWAKAPLALNGRDQIKPHVLLVNGKRMVKNPDYSLAMYRDPDGRAWLEQQFQNVTVPQANRIREMRGDAQADLFLAPRRGLMDRMLRWAQQADTTNPGGGTTPPPGGGTPPPGGGTPPPGGTAGTPRWGQPIPTASRPGPNGTDEEWGKYIQDQERWAAINGLLLTHQRLLSNPALKNTPVGQRWIDTLTRHPDWMQYLPKPATTGTTNRTKGTPATAADTASTATQRSAAMPSLGAGIGSQAQTTPGADPATKGTPEPAAAPQDPAAQDPKQLVAWKPQSTPSVEYYNR